MGGLFWNDAPGSGRFTSLIDVESFTFRERAWPRPLFLHNRGLEPLYNVAGTLRAFALIQQRYPDATLTLAHDGPLRGALERLAKEPAPRRVRPWRLLPRHGM